MDQIQIVQNKHRQALIDFWNIPESACILEIGCGQGDTTALLAKAVGEGGFVHAIDPAPGSYGAPVTLEEARSKLLNSDIGKRISIDLDTDIFSSVFYDCDKSFDYVVLSHCSWYFESAGLLYETLSKARSYALNLCFAEWDIRINSVDRIGHYQSVMIQAECNSFGKLDDSNIRTLFTPYDIIDIAEKAGWSITKDTTIDSSYLQDGKWEINNVVNDYPQIIHSMDAIPLKTKDLLLSEIKLLENMPNEYKSKSLNTFAFNAK